MTGAVFDPKPTVIGHRGFGRGSVEAGERTVVENTVESYAAAVGAGLRWVEVDAQRTADDVLVVRHDPTTPDGAFLIDQPAARLHDQGIPALADVLDALPATVGVNVDVKTVIEDAVDAPARRTGALLAPVLAAEARRRPLFVSSFDPSLLAYLKEHLPGVPLGLIGWVNFPLRHAVAAAANLGFQAVCLHTGSFGVNRIEGGPVHRSPGFSVETAHRAGLEVVTWCPKPEDAAGYVAAGVDALVVNDVPGTLTVLAGGPPPTPEAETRQETQPETQPEAQPVPRPEPRSEPEGDARAPATVRAADPGTAQPSAGDSVVE